MNWDISTGRFKQSYGRVLQSLGRYLARRGLVLEGEALEYAGRLQMRYGMLKHQVQWNHAPLLHARATAPQREVRAGKVRDSVQ
jgi:uncharacterized protein YjbJ (UPF0337 family)